MAEDSEVSGTLRDMARAVRAVGGNWALIGGQALIAHGVPRHTLDADALLGADLLGEVADHLVDTFEWVPLLYDADTGDYLDTDTPTVHYMDDPVLFDVQQERMMIPLRSASGVQVDLLAAQHPVEEEMVDLAKRTVFQGVQVPLAPLGGILLVKVKADRTKDVAAVEQAAEHLPADQVEEAIQWATERDPGTAEDLRSIMDAARKRRGPKRVARRPKPRK